MPKSIIYASQLLQDIADETAIPIESKDFSQYLDNNDELRQYRDQFYYPTNATIPHVDLTIVDENEDCVYLSGNSLGLCPKAAVTMINKGIKSWQMCGAMARHSGEHPWESIGENTYYQLAELVGAQTNEIVMMNSLTVNLHFLMVSFYQPTSKRYKIMIEAGTFPSDFVAVRSQIAFHGYNPDDSLIVVSPRTGEHTLRTEDIVGRIDAEGDEIALIMFSGVNFYTGQYFDLEAITAAGLRRGCRVGFDLGHAVGNVEMKLHEWHVDFACWCSYKYLNGGPDAPGGVFVHEKHANDSTLKRFDGWWGIEFQKRFAMDLNDISFTPGAMSYATSTPPVMSTFSVMASLDIFNTVGMSKLIRKQQLLTGLLEYLLRLHFDSDDVEILTPGNVNERGSQLSVLFALNLEKVFKGIQKRGVLCDMRRNNVLRLAACPLYNSFSDIYRFVVYLKQAIEENTH